MTLCTRIPSIVPIFRPPRSVTGSHALILSPGASPQVALAAAAAMLSKQLEGTSRRVLGALRRFDVLGVPSRRAARDEVRLHVRGSPSEVRGACFGGAGVRALRAVRALHVLGSNRHVRAVAPSIVLTCRRARGMMDAAQDTVQGSAGSRGGVRDAPSCS